MTRALMAIERTIGKIETKSRTASRGARVAMAFGMIAAGYGAIIVTASSAGGFA